MKLAGTYPIRLLCQLLGVPRSSVYYQPQPVADAEAMFKAALLDLAGEWPTYGYRRLTAMMRRLDWPVNGKRVRRWMDEHIPETIAKIGRNPETISYWRKELDKRLSEMEKLTGAQNLGAKTATEWKVKIGELRTRVNQVLGEE